MDSFSILDPSTNVFGFHFLEASAGTGKTFAIEHLVPRLLLEAKGSISIEDILVVTFTRAATRELKARIYQNLRSILRALEKGSGGPPYLERLYAQGKEVVERARMRIEEALCFFERASIYTLHGFCLRLLQEFSFETNAFFSAVDEEELMKKESIAECIKDFFRVKVNEKWMSQPQFRKLCSDRKIGKDVNALATAILRILEKGGSIKNYPDASVLWEHWNQTLASLPSLSEEDLWKEFSLVAPRIVNSAKWKSQISRLFFQIAKGHSSYEEWTSFLDEKTLFLEQIKEPPIKNREKIRYPELFLKLRRELLSVHKQATNPKTLLLQLAAACKERYHKGKEVLLHFTPDDFVQQLEMAMQKPAFKEKVQERYQALIIDEFQDTDPDQWSVFKALFFERPSPPVALYLVGDPKQSIYGFRSADVYTYLQARDQYFKPEERYYLGTNFRSHPALITALNSLFSHLLPKEWMPLPYRGDHLLVRPVLSSPMKDSSLEDDKGTGRLHFLLQKEGKEENLLYGIAQEIVRLRKEWNVPFNTIAVLVKDRYQASQVQQIFLDFGIPSQMQQYFSVQDSAFTAMKELVQVLITPFDLSAVKKLLSGLFCSFSSDEVMGSWDNPLCQRVRDYIVNRQSVVQKKGFGVFFSDFLQERSFCRVPDKSLEEELLERKHSTLYFSLRQLMQILLENAGSALYDGESLFAFLQSMETFPADHSMFKRAREEEEDQVQVMTLHKSKGLEFPVVFALGLASRHKGLEAYFLIRSEGGKEVVASEEGESFDSLHREEVDAEKLRQLYVALTRAKERVYIPWVFSQAQAAVIYGTASPLELFIGGFGLENYAFSQVYERIRNFSEENFLAHLHKLQEFASVTYSYLKPLDTRTFCFEDVLSKEIVAPNFEPVFSFDQGVYCSFSSLAQDEKRSTYREVLVEEDLLPAGVETGVIIHSILEEFCKLGLHQKTEEERLFCVTKYCQNTQLASHILSVFNLLEEILRVPISLTEETVRLCDIQADDMQAEVEFLYPLGTSLIKGFIDLIFRYKGKYYVLDWKTNQLSDYKVSSLVDCMKEHQYYLQAAIYAYALQKQLGLYTKNKKEATVCFGGAVYFFLRGRQPLYFKPDSSLLEAQGVLLEGERGALWNVE